MMKQVLLYVILCVSLSLNLMAVTPQARVNSGGNEFPQFFSGDTLYYISTGKLKSAGDEQELQFNSIMSKAGYHLYCNKNGENIDMHAVFAGSFANASANASDFTISKASAVDAPLVFAMQSSKEIAGVSGVTDLYQQNTFSDTNSCERILSSYKHTNMMPALSACGNVLFFVSDRQGGQGGLDIWYSVRDEYGYWQRANNLEVLNTPGDDITPHCGTDGKFYFASNWKGEAKGDYDIFVAPYFGSKGILLPMKGKPVANINTHDNEKFPVINAKANTIVFASDRGHKIENYDIYKELLHRTHSILHIENPGSASSYWLIDRTAGDRFEILPARDYALEIGHDYEVMAPDYICEDCGEKASHFWKMTITSDTLIRMQMPMFNKGQYRKTLIMQNDMLAKLFIHGYWKPLTKNSLSEFRTAEKAGLFNNSSYVDSSLYPYANMVESSEQLWANTVQDIAQYLNQYSYYCKNADTLNLSLLVYTMKENLGHYKNNPYRKNKSSIYPGDTVLINDGDNVLRIPTGLDITKSSWKVDGVKYKIKGSKQGGNLLMTQLRAYYAEQLLDSLLNRYSPIYSFLKAENRIKFSYKGMGVDENNKSEQNRIEIRMHNQRILLLAGKDGVSEHSKPQRIMSTPPEINPSNLLELKLSTSGNKQIISTTTALNTQATVNAKGNTMKTQTVQQQMRFVPPMVYRHNTMKVNIKDVITSQQVGYDIDIKEYDTMDDARTGLKLLRFRELDGCHIVINYDFWGNKTYILKSPRFETKQAAIDFKRKNKASLKQINPDAELLIK